MNLAATAARSRSERGAISSFLGVFALLGGVIFLVITVIPFFNSWSEKSAMEGAYRQIVNMKPRLTVQSTDGSSIARAGMPTIQGELRSLAKTLDTNADTGSALKACAGLKRRTQNGIMYVSGAEPMKADGTQCNLALAPNDIDAKIAAHANSPGAGRNPFYVVVFFEGYLRSLILPADLSSANQRVEGTAPSEGVFGGSSGAAPTPTPNGNSPTGAGQEPSGEVITEPVGSSTNPDSGMSDVFSQ